MIVAPDLDHPGLRPRTSAYRRVVVSLFAAGIATFTLLYSTQAVLPALATRFGVSAGRSAWSLSATTLGLALALLVAGQLAEQGVHRVPAVLAGLGFDLRPVQVGPDQAGPQCAGLRHELPGRAKQAVADAAHHAEPDSPWLE